ncbi:MAG: carboxypeptidase-like regulatory domain-containing protein [Bacteroidales bacterium]|nr:carboxypeptidase-like regulatory domain-containing protein [Bacteroidales bacterium]
MKKAYIVLITILLVSCASNNYDNVDVIKGKFKITNRTIDKNCKEGYAILTGNVYDIFTGTVGAYANISIEELKVGTSANEKGDFYLEVPVGEHTIQILLSGSTTMHKTIKFKEKEKVEVSVLLGTVCIW